MCNNMKIDFSNIEVEVNFEGDTRRVDVRRELANFAKVKTMDIGLEDFCREIYYSKGEIEVPDKYVQPLIGIVMLRDCPFYAFVKSGVLKLLRQETMKPKQ